jgi:hypothetical protein
VRKPEGFGSSWTKTSRAYNRKRCRCDIRQPQLGKGSVMKLTTALVVLGLAIAVPAAAQMQEACCGPSSMYNEQNSTPLQFQDEWFQQQQQQQQQQEMQQENER